MHAITYNEYGTPAVLRFQEVAKPAPQAGEVLVRVQAASINAADWHLLSADIFLVRLMTGGLLKPRYSILGAAIAGRVEAVGQNVTQLRPGDAVFGDLLEGSLGGLAEYVCAPEKALAFKPDNISFAEAAAVPVAATTALQGLRDKGRLQPGQHVLINGASGGVGTFAVQLAKMFGAEVTAVCSPRNLDQARALGADHVIDYTREDFTRNGQRYDLILAANGYHWILDYRRALRPGGIYVTAGGTLAALFQAALIGPWLSRSGQQTVSVLSAKPNQADLVYLAGLLATGKIKSVVEQCYPLCETAEAFRYLGAGHAQGKIVINIG